jgi:hypothetical protein
MIRLWDIMTDFGRRFRSHLLPPVFCSEGGGSRYIRNGVTTTARLHVLTSQGQILLLLLLSSLSVL